MSRLDERPVDPRTGLPIPFVAETAEGKADFAVLQAPRQVLCAQRDLCGVCGRLNDYWKVFLGGPKAAEHGSYTDPPMHEECAEASMQLCPYIARPVTKRSTRVERRPDVVTPAGFIDAKPDEWVMLYTRGYKFREERGVFLANAPAKFRRFVRGEGGLLREVPGA